MIQMASLYSSIKAMANEVIYYGKPRGYIKTDIIRRIKYTSCFREYITPTRYWEKHGKRRLGRKLFDKYHKIGLKSKEKEMVYKMVDNIVDALETKETFTGLGQAIATMSVYKARAEEINEESEKVIAELVKITEELEECSPTTS